MFSCPSSYRRRLGSAMKFLADGHLNPQSLIYTSLVARSGSWSASGQARDAKKRLPHRTLPARYTLQSHRSHELTPSHVIGSYMFRSDRRTQVHTYISDPPRSRAGNKAEKPRTSHHLTDSDCCIRLRARSTGCSRWTPAMRLSLLASQSAMLETAPVLRLVLLRLVVAACRSSTSDRFRRNARERRWTPVRPRSCCCFCFGADDDGLGFGIGFVGFGLSRGIGISVGRTNGALLSGSRINLATSSRRSNWCTTANGLPDQPCSTNPELLFRKYSL